ncbi:universal stress protein [Actinoplanes sp. N902-109]|uniref:universal stress protein n=1 Tax=Actinoplanes sp. (strain N902-109) TaxID=649831 RepID=UPI0018DD0D1D|nr:universal stress protein [Actinoplanes sp. N902-109]
MAAGIPVVAGVDGSARSRHAVEIAAAEAARRHRPLRLVHALGWPELALGGAPVVHGASSSVRRQAVTWLAEAAELAAATAPEAVVTTALVLGRPAAVLTEHSHHAELIVVGGSGLGGMLLGSVAGTLVSHAACPVLVVRGDRGRAGPVVAGVDGSASGPATLDVALQEASLRKTSLVALHAWADADMSPLDPPHGGDGDHRRGLARGQRALAEALAGAGERYPDVAVRREVLHGDAGMLLTAWSQAAQLLVIGDRHHHGPGSFALGPVGRRLIFHAGCPTTVVNAQLLVP